MGGKQENRGDAGQLSGGEGVQGMPVIIMPGEKELQLPDEEKGEQSVCVGRSELCGSGQRALR